VSGPRMQPIRLHGDPRPLLDATQQIRTRVGHCQPYGASCPPGCRAGDDGDWINFAVPSTSLRELSLLLFDAGSGLLAIEVLLDPALHRTGQVWHVEVAGLRRPVRYAWQGRGKVLLDPWARAVARVPGEPFPVYHGYFPVPGPAWEHPRPPRRPLQDLVVYELHVKAFTAHPSSGVARPGSYAGLIEKIPYLQELGVNAVELMPVAAFDPEATIFRDPATGEKLRNAWGYDPLALLAPAPHYAAGGGPFAAAEEFRAMVDAFHGAGMEVLLDIVLNHTGEGSRAGPTHHFRALDEDLWYMVGEDGAYRDYTGCGNTFNCNHPVVRAFILDCLRCWVTEFGVDGFRFDLAAVLGRDSQGRVLANPPVIEQISLDPVLADVRLIAEAWDATGLVQVGRFDEGLPEGARRRPGGPWAEWNGRFRDDIRRLARGEAGLTGAAATRLCGSADLGNGHRRPSQSLNFVTAHDGFTLADLVSYERKRNEANGEDNRDGSNDNHAWNSGVEGPTDDPAVLDIRARRQRSLLALLFLSQGVPMLLYGDEFGRSQHGNNNAWCQDNERFWVDWSLAGRHAGLLAITRSLIALRKRHACLRHERFLTAADIEWHGVEPFEPDFGPGARCLAWRLKGLEQEGRRQPDLYGAFNFESVERSFRLPSPGTGSWRLLFDSADGRPAHLDETLAPMLEGGRILPPWSLLLLAAEGGS
jgi:isoamylase